MDVFVFSTYFLIQTKVLEGLQGVGGAFNEKTLELRCSKIFKKRKEKSELSNSEIIYLIKFQSYVTRFFDFHFFILKFPSYEKLAVTSQFDLTRFYGVVIRNSVFQLGFLTLEFQIPSISFSRGIQIFIQIILFH